MSFNAEQLFALLPAVYRNRDAETGGPLQALYAVLAQQLGIVEDNIEQLYDDQFIETCASWVIPYIGDLIGYNSIYEVAGASFDSRAEVANSIGYRRRKGTLLALEQVAADVSGRSALAVEEFRRLITTESMRLVRPHHASNANLRHARALDEFGTAFDRESRTIDVRRIAPRVRASVETDTTPLDSSLHGAGRCNIPNIAIHLWRLKARPVVNAPAFGIGQRRFMFSPFGANLRLFSQPQPRASFSRLTARIDIPEPISRAEFSRGLRLSDAPQFYGKSASVLVIADGVPVPSSRIVGANLCEIGADQWCTVPSGRIAIDPELGRIRFADDVPLPNSLRLNYSYGAAADIGGGSYDRSSSLTMLKVANASLVVVIGSTDAPTLEDAVAQWNDLVSISPALTGIIVLPNFERLSVDLTGSAAIQLPAGSNLTIASGEAIASAAPDDVIWNNSCCTLSGDIDIAAGATSTQSLAGQLLLSGFWLAGRVAITGGAATVQMADMTLVPGISLDRAGEPVCSGDPSLQVSAEEVSLTVVRSITGPIAADPGGTTRVCSSIVDSTSACCVAYAAFDLSSAGADLHVEDSTIIGKVHARTIPLASDTIFHARRARRDPWPAAIWAGQRQTGCLRFCSLPFDSVTPRRYVCLPPDAASQDALAPKFVTTRFGRPGYGLLSGDVPLAVWQGADNGSQIGVYHQIQETEAVRNVQIRAPEYLPATLESGIFLHPSREIHEIRKPHIDYGVARTCCDDEGLDWTAISGIGIGLM